MKKIQVLLGIFLVSMSFSSLHPMNWGGGRRLNDGAQVHRDHPVLKAVFVVAAAAGFWVLCKKYNEYGDCSFGAEVLKRIDCASGDGRSCAIVKICLALCHNEPEDIVKNTECFAAKMTALVAPEYMNEYMDRVMGKRVEEMVRDGVKKGINAFFAGAKGAFEELFQNLFE